MQPVRPKRAALPARSAGITPALSPAIVHALPQSVILAEPVRDDRGNIQDFVIVDANAAARDASETPPAPFIGTRLSDVLTTPAGRIHFREVIGAFERGSRIRFRGLDTSLLSGRQPQRYINLQAVRAGALLVISWEDVTEEYEERQRLNHQAQHDPLTGLDNRASLMARLAAIPTLEQRHGQRLAALFCDLDDFKAINDTHGHAIGDAVLQTVAHRLQSCIRNGDIAARIGGDEFLVLLTGMRSHDDAKHLASQLLGELAQPMTFDGVTIQVAASIGIAVARRGEDPRLLVARADEAMYDAKHAGKNGVCQRSA